MSGELVMIPPSTRHDFPVFRCCGREAERGELDRKCRHDCSEAFSLFSVSSYSLGLPLPERTHTRIPRQLCCVCEKLQIP